MDSLQISLSLFFSLQIKEDRTKACLCLPGMTSWQTRPAAGVAVVGTDREGSNLTQQLDKIFDKHVYRENFQLFFSFFFFFYQKSRTQATLESYVRCGLHGFVTTREMSF